MKKKIKAFFYKFLSRAKIKTYGENNVVKINNSVYTKHVSIKIYGNNNTVVFEDGVYLHNVSICIGFSKCPIDNCTVKIGKNTGFNSALIQLGESDSHVEIGSDCMFSYNVEINCTDQHAIFNKDNELINVGRYVNIGSHVWVCKKVTIMKNSNIPDGCILAEGCVVAKHFEKENCVIAGNPAKVVKEDIHWDKQRPQNYIRQLENKN